MSAPEATVSQHIGPFLPSTVHLAVPVSQYPSIQSNPHHHHLSDSRSSSPRSASTIHNPTGTHQDPLSSRHLEKMASMKGGSAQGREGEVSREVLYGTPPSLHEDKPALSPSSYSSSGHVPKVSFDTVVKEYGGSRDCPTGRYDVYIRSSLSGKEGSLKHRILTRPSDSDLPDDFSKVSGMHGLKDEPVAKRPNLASAGSTSMSHSVQTVPTLHNDNLRSNNRHLPEAHAAPHHSVSKSSNNLEPREISHQSDNTLSKQHIHQHEPYQQTHSEGNSTENRRSSQKQYHSSPSITPPSTSPHSEDHSSHLQYPCHFLKGSIIQLANGTLKRVENLQTEDFVNSAEISSDLKVDSSTVVKIEESTDSGTAMLSFSVGEHRVQVTVEATLEHPFFVFGQGWSSCSVSRTLARYGLDCQKLNVGDICISLTHKDVTLKAAEISKQQHQPEQMHLTDSHRKLDTISDTDTSENQIPSLSSLPPTSTSSGFSSSILPSSLKLEHTYTNILPSSSVTQSTSGKIRLSQMELPPPSSNIVLVKKETNNNNTKKRDSHRFESELKEEMFDEEESDSASSQCQRRYSTANQDSMKADLEHERLKHLETKYAQNNEETLQMNISDSGRQ